MSGTIVLDSVSATRQAVRKAKVLGDIALVPTMGALHEGHLSLVRAAKQQCKTVVVSVFVNPTQFGPGEDLDRYPRNLEADLGKLGEEGVELVFTPSVHEMYPDSSVGTSVEVPGIADRLDGRSRPGHFRGVATVVTKLFHIVSPDYAFFGQKDAAQVAVLRAMVRDLDFPLELVVCPTVREPDGLAMSSRNHYLNADERRHARLLYQALCAARDAASLGVRDAVELRKIILKMMECDSVARLEYAEVVHPDTLLPIADSSSGALVAIAAWIGATRLIDNLLLPATEAKTCE
jgi:pantoate--beta-alanine ligase